MFFRIRLGKSSHASVPINESFLGMSISNVTCSMDYFDLQVTNSHGTLLIEIMSSYSPGVQCKADFSVSDYAGQLLLTVGMDNPFAVVTVDPAEVNGYSYLACHFNPLVVLDVLPPDPFLKLVFSMLDNGTVIGSIGSNLCHSMLSTYAEQFKPISPPSPPLPLNDGAQPLQNTTLFSSVARVVEALPPFVPGAEFRVQFVGDTALRVGCSFSKRQIVSADRFAPLIQRLLRRFPSETLEKWSSLSLEDWSLGFVMLKDSFVSFDINLKSFEFDPSSYAIRVDQQDGVWLSNLVFNETEYTNHFLSYIFPLALETLNSVLNTQLGKLPPVNGHQVQLPWNKPHTRSCPPTLIIILFVLVCIALCGSVVMRSYQNYIRQPICDVRSSLPVGLRRIVTEDLILTIGISICAGCFVWSNLTTAATVVVGQELVVYSFSLRSTVTDLYAAGLSPLSFAVALFSGVYPYLKLAAVLYYTAIMNDPDSKVLHAMDYLGKLSLLDTFVMLLMVTGLTIPGIADVDVYAPFYIFLLGTLGSIAMGNYATHIWRRGTDARRSQEEPVEIIGEPTAAVPDNAQTVEVAASNAEDESSGLIDMARDKLSFLWSLVQKWKYMKSTSRVGAVFFLSVLAWFLPLVSYRVDGLGPYLTQPYKTFTLTGLSVAVSSGCLVVTFFTVLVAPCVYVLSPKRFRWLASWCAADALVLACLAGLLQLNDFVEFIVGEELIGVYSAHATLHLSFLPLLGAAVYVWWLVIEDLCQLNGITDAWSRLRFLVSAEPEELVRLTPED